MNSNTPPTQPENRGARLDNFDVKSWREGFTLTMLRLASLVGIVLIAVAFPTTVMIDRILFIGLYLLLLAATVLSVPYILRATALLLTTYAVGMNAILDWGPWADGNIFLLATVALCAILLDQRIDIATLVVSIISIAVAGILQQTGVLRTVPSAPALAPVDWVIYIFDFSIVAAVITAAIGQFKFTFIRAAQETQSFIRTLETEKKELETKAHTAAKELDTRMAQFRTSSSAVRVITEIENISELLETTTQLISEKFGHYHVGLFVLDDQKRTAFLQAASSVTGKQIIGKSIRIPLDKRDPFYRVVEQSQPVILSDQDTKSFVIDANFPLTRSRMILPIASRGSMIGLLDLHSDQPDAFDTDDAEIIRILADLTAISFDNVRLVNETKSLISQLEINTAVQSKRTWSKLTSRFKPAYQYTPAGVRPVFSNEKRDENGALLVPLVLHGQKIGAIKLKRKGVAAQWSERERNLIEKIADQVALALENSRLVDEAQKNALRDQMIANISTRIRETLDVESVIRTTATELRRIFDLKEAEIVIGSTQMDLLSKRNTTQ